MSTPLAAAYATACAQRDRARTVAIRLEEENAALIEFLIGIGACTVGVDPGLARSAATADEVLAYARDVLRVWHQL